MGEWESGVGWGEVGGERWRRCGERGGVVEACVERRCGEACAESARGSGSGYEGPGAERERDREREREARPRAEGAEGADLCVQVSDAGHDLYEEPPRLGLAAPPVLHDVLK